MKDEILASQFDRHFNEFAHPLQTCGPDLFVAVQKRHIRWPMETETNAEGSKFPLDFGPLIWAEFFREIAGIVETNLDQPETVPFGEINKIVEITSALDISETESSQFSADGVGDQVLRSFFLAAGNRTLFRIRR